MRLSNEQFLTIILAAGKGTRMKSAKPKVLHCVGGKPMLQHVIDAATKAGSAKNIVVVGFGREAVKNAISDETQIVVQEEQLGTGHAVLQAQPFVQDEDTVMVLCGDTPLLTAKVLKNFFEVHKKEKAEASVLTTIMPNPAGYGRVIRGLDGSVEKIVEHKDATIAERSVTEINTGIYCFEAKSLFAALKEVGHDNAQKEYYLPDVLAILRKAGKKITAVVVDDYEETLGINSRTQLSVAEAILHKRKNEELMENGVTIIDPLTTYVDADVEIGPDTVLYPSTFISGKSVIGAGCKIGPCTRLIDVQVGDGSVLSFTDGEDSVIAAKATIGPYVHLRPNTKIAVGVHIGNFVEVKNSNVGEGTKLPHLSYIGDSDIGAGVNMGCGTITVNYDGKTKHRTTIGDRVFVGCNSNLVAPVKIEDDAYIGAGSTITKDVPAGQLAVARSRQTNIEHWQDKRK